MPDQDPAKDERTNEPPAASDPTATSAEDDDFADEHNDVSLADEQPGGPEGEPEDDSPRGLAGSD